MSHHKSHCQHDHHDNNSIILLWRIHSLANQFKSTIKQIRLYLKRLLRDDNNKIGIKAPRLLSTKRNISTRESIDWPVKICIAKSRSRQYALRAIVKYTRTSFARRTEDFRLNLFIDCAPPRIDFDFAFHRPRTRESDWLRCCCRSIQATNFTCSISHTIRRNSGQMVLHRICLLNSAETWSYTLAHCDWCYTRGRDLAIGTGWWPLEEYNAADDEGDAGWDTMIARRTSKQWMGD